MAGWGRDDDAFDPKLVAEAEERDRRERADRHEREQAAKRRSEPKPEPPPPHPKQARALLIARVIDHLTFERGPVRIDQAMHGYDGKRYPVDVDIIQDLVDWGWAVRTGDQGELVELTPQGRVVAMFTDGISHFRHKLV